MKKITIIGNWKLNGTKNLVKKFSKKINLKFKKYSKFINIVLSPPYVYIDRMRKKIKDKKNIFLGSQNTDLRKSGAYTGEISVNMLKDIGVKYIFIGHSERRIYHKENNKKISKKFKIVKDNKLIPILCIGETKKEKKYKLTKVILKKQIKKIFNLCGKNAFKNSYIAYEPVWAIGSGKSASIKDINKVHQFIKDYIFKKSKINNNYKKNFYIQYGGSVTEDNALEIISQKNVDGLLIGANSLNYKKFLKIIDIVYKYYKNKYNV
ncbi:triose-phosphate isomerase [Buchnera aphidicola]|uniref:triose-phosphate isomerase n=1 Tax=Buchnera aphidicola TaxID=9 RepID=UPI0034639D52